MAEMQNSVLILVLIIIAFGVTVSVYIYRGRRAISKVIEIFYEHHALGSKDAKTLKELGLEKPDFARRIMRGRDFKQDALQVLMKRGLICLTEDGKLYMVKDKLGQDLRYRGRDPRPQKS